MTSTKRLDSESYTIYKFRLTNHTFLFTKSNILKDIDSKQLHMKLKHIDAQKRPEMFLWVIGPQWSLK